MHTTLLAVLGTSPAILTETVWALAQEKPACIPDEVVVITTTTGAKELQNVLLTKRWKDESAWTSLRRSVLGKRASVSSHLQLTAPRIIELPNHKSGVKLPADDLRTPADNAAAADFILEEVRRLTENPDTRVVASIAGGRKTMGALLYAAMSLLGRETDRLTHVLVNDPYDTCRDFFFPTQPVDPTVSLLGKAGLSAVNARIDLADIPFVPLRNLFERDFAQRPGSFDNLVIEASGRLPNSTTPKVVVRQDRTEIEVEGFKITFNANEYTLFLLLVNRCIEGKSPFTGHDKVAQAYLEFAHELYAAHDPNDFGDWRADISRTITTENIRKYISSIRTKFRHAGRAGRDLDFALTSRKGVSLNLNPKTLTKI